MEVNLIVYYLVGWVLVDLKILLGLLHFNWPFLSKACGKMSLKIFISILSYYTRIYVATYVANKHILNLMT